MKQMIAIAVLSLASTMPLLREPAHGYGINVTVRPEGSGKNANPYELLAPRTAPTTYVCTVDVTDLASKATMTGPKVVVSPGTKQTREKNLGEMNAIVTAVVSRDGDQVTWDVVLQRGLEVVAKQHSDAMLRPPLSTR